MARSSSAAEPSTFRSNPGEPSLSAILSSADTTMRPRDVSDSITRPDASSTVLSAGGSDLALAVGGPCRPLTFLHFMVYTTPLQ